VGIAAGMLAGIGPLMQAYVDDLGFAGIAVAVAQRGEVLFAGEYGWRDREAGLPMTPDTIFRIYSMTKPITAVAFMTLVEEGRVSLDDEVARYLPGFESMQVLADGGELVDATRPIVMRDLLTHTAGMTHELQPTPAAGEYRRAHLHFDATRTLAEFTDVVAGLPLAFQPGGRWHYSAGFEVVARVTEVVTGQPFGALLRTRIFAPLGMDDTGFAVPPADVGRLAAMYGLPDVFALGLTPQALAEAIPAGIEQRRDVSTTHPTDAPDVFARGGYGLYSTVGDFLRFAQMLAGGGQLDGHRVLSDDTVALMYRNHLTAAQLDLFDTFMPGHGFGFGSAVVLDPTRATGTAGGHGWGSAASTTFWVDPANDVVGVLMAQSMLAPNTPEHELRAIVHAALAA